MTLTWITLALLCQDWNRPDPRWETTLSLWQDLARIPPGSLDAEEHKMLVRTMEGRTWYSEALPARMQSFVKRAFKRRIDQMGSAPAYPKSASEAWGTIQYEFDEAREIQNLGRKTGFFGGQHHQWISQRMLDCFEWALVKVAQIPLEKRLEEMKLSRDAYLTMVQKLAAEMSQLGHFPHRFLPPVVGPPAELTMFGRRDSVDIVLGTKDYLVNKSDKPLKVIFYTDSSPESCPSITLEPGAILTGCEINVLLCAVVESNLGPFIKRLADPDSQVSAITRRQIMAYRCLAIGPLVNALNGEEFKNFVQVKNLISQMGGW